MKDILLAALLSASLGLPSGLSTAMAAEDDTVTEGDTVAEADADMETPPPRRHKSQNYTSIAAGAVLFAAVAAAVGRWWFMSPKVQIPPGTAGRGESSHPVSLLGNPTGVSSTSTAQTADPNPYGRDLQTLCGGGDRWVVHWHLDIEDSSQRGERGSMVYNSKELLSILRGLEDESRLICYSYLFLYEGVAKRPYIYIVVEKWKNNVALFRDTDIEIVPVGVVMQHADGRCRILDPENSLRQELLGEGWTPMTPGEAL